jgi:hypothetical protein
LAGFFNSLEVSDLPDGAHVTVNMGAGLLHRAPDGTWSRPRVLFTYGEVQFPAMGPPTWTSSLALLALVVAAAGFLVLVVPPLRRPPRRGVAAGLISLLGGGALLGFFMLFLLGDSRVPGIWTAVGSVVVFVISAIVYSTKQKPVGQPSHSGAPPPSTWPPGPPLSSWPPKPPGT